MMMREICDNLDAFLLGDLRDADETAFRTHLQSCAVCREAAEEQRWIDGLLHSPMAAQFESPSPALIDSLTVSLARRRRRRDRRLIACGLAAAAAVLLVAVGWLELNGIAPNERSAEVASAAREGRQELDENVAAFIAGDDTLAVPVESRHPNVTLVRVYPVYRPSYATQVGTNSIPARHGPAALGFNGG